MHTTSEAPSKEQVVPWNDYTHNIFTLFNKGVSLDYIFLLVMTNSQGSGVIDRLAASLQGITDQNKETNAMQQQLATMLAFIAKVEDDGSNILPDGDHGGTIPTSDMQAMNLAYNYLQNHNFPDNPGLFQQLNNVYWILTNGEVPDWNNHRGGAPFAFMDLTDGNVWTLTHTVDPNYDYELFCKLQQDFQANGPTSVLGMIATTINTATANIQGMSTEETTEIQSDAQLITTYDKIGQDAIELTNQSKSSMVQRQIPGS